MQIDMSLSWSRSSPRSFITLAPCYFQPGIEVLHGRMEYFLNSWDCCFRHSWMKPTGWKHLLGISSTSPRSSHLRSNIKCSNVQFVGKSCRSKQFRVLNFWGDSATCTTILFNSVSHHICPGNPEETRVFPGNPEETRVIRAMLVPYRPKQFT